MQKNYHYYNVNKFLEETPELYYWMGFLYADSCLFKPKTKYKTSYKLKLQLSELQPIIDFCNYFEIDTNFIEFAPSRNVTYSNEKTYIIKKSYVITIMVSDIVDRFKKFGIIPNKTYIFQEIDIENNLLLPYFLKGVVCGDGSFYNYKRKKDDVQINHFSLTGNKDFIDWYCLKLKDLGYEGTLNPRIKHINKEKNHITKEICISGTNKVKNIYKLLLGNSSPRLERKWLKVQLLFNKENELSNEFN